MKRHLALLGGLVLAAAVVSPLAAQDDELRKEIEALKKGQQEIQKQLEEIKKLLAARPTAAAGPNVKDVVFELGDNPVVGVASAKLTLIEWTDYQ